MGTFYGNQPVAPNENERALLWIACEQIFPVIPAKAGIPRRRSIHRKEAGSFSAN
ncbi:MAG TPA: hypothetical protein VMN38_05255 [Sphingomicrobium sp.]|nr:hypothetical protein [Sphingomicrobium sp.]